MYDKNVWEAMPCDTVIHNMDARTKLMILIAFAIMAVTIDSSRTLFLLFSMTLILHLVAKSSLARWRILMIFILFGMWGTMVSQALFYNQEPRTIVACLVSPMTKIIGTVTGGLFLYREGLEYGSIQALRSGIMLSVGLLLCWTSDPRQLLRSFLAWKMPYELAFMLITSLRFLPVVFEETAVVLTAQRLRGFEPYKSLSPKRLIQTAFQTLFPILARTLRRAGTLAFSVESRGFGRDTRQIEVANWSILQKYCCGSIIVLLLILVMLKVIYALQFNGIFYFAKWQSIYDIIKYWM